MAVVKLIAATDLTDMSVMWDQGYQDRDETLSADELAEFAGRNCYRSFNRPNPKTAANEDYLDHILEIGHESVLEHASASFYIEASRSVLAEITRHRHLSFSVVSQRYVDANTLGYHVPPVYYDLPDADRDEALAILHLIHRNNLAAYNDLMAILERNNKPRKKAREGARAVLPGMTSSPMVVSGNHRAWRYVIANRWHASADAEIQEVAGLLLEQLREIAPGTYQDIPETPFGS